MAFNGSGVFQRLYNWTNDAAANIKIRADRMDNEMNGMATGLSTCITKDGQTTVTANLPMAGFRHTGVGAGTSRTDYTRLDQAQDGKLAWVDGGGTSDAITASYGIPITALVDGQLCFVRATAANATTTPTFSPNSLTARTIVKTGGQALAVGDIYGDGHELVLRYDLSNTRWELLNPAALNVPFTAASASGPATLAFAEDTDNGSNKVTLSAPSSIASDVTVTLPGVAATLSTLDGTETFTNKTLTNCVANTQTTGDNSTKIATTAYVDGITTGSASQSDMESASSTVKYVSPGNMKYHPGVPKAAGTVTFSGGTPSLAAGSFGVTSITDAGTGITTINLSVTFSSTNYQAMVTLVGVGTTAKAQNKTTTSFQVRTEAESSGSFPATDINFDFVVFGDL